MAKIIAISGWKSSGKDTTADYLVNNYGFKKFSFANMLKNMVAKQYNIPRESCDNPKYKEQPLLNYPVDPKDEFSLSISKFMFKEFRTRGGNTPVSFVNDIAYGPKFQGFIKNSEFSEVLYWSARSLCILEGSVKRTVNSSYWVGEVINSIYQKETELNTQNLEGCYAISDLRYESEVSQLREAFKEDLLTVRINRFATAQSDDPSERNLDKHNFDFIIENKEALNDLYKDIDSLSNVLNIKRDYDNINSNTDD